MRRRRIAKNQWKKQLRDTHGRWAVKDEEQRRCDMLRIRVTSDEHEALLLCAEARGQTVTRYIIECCLVNPGKSNQARREPRDQFELHRMRLRHRAMRRG